MRRLIDIAIRHYKEDSKSQFLYRVLRALIAESVGIQKWLRLKIFWLRYKDRYVVRNIQGNKMYLSIKDKGISSSLIGYGFWEPLATKILRETVSKGDIVVDIGANMGYFVLQESKLVGETGKVFAIEPVAENLKLLKKNLGLNQCANVETFQLAIGDKNEESSIFLSYRLNCGSMVFRDGLNLVDGAIKKLPVTVVTLDKFLEDKPTPSLIRMDVEGYEFEIIQGMKNLLAKKCPLKLFIEVHPGYLKKEKLVDMLDTLKNHGFYCEIAVDRQLDSRSHLLQKIFYYLSDKINEDSINGYLYRNSDLDDLKKFGSREIYPHVLFTRNGRAVINE